MQGRITVEHQNVGQQLILRRKVYGDVQLGLEYKNAQGVYITHYLGVDAESGRLYYKNIITGSTTYLT